MDISDTIRSSREERAIVVRDGHCLAETTVLYLSRREVEAFFRRIPASRLRDRLLFDLMYRHALRRREAANLLLDDLRGGRVRIRRLKGSIAGEYPLHPATVRLLSRYLARRGEDASPYLFPGRVPDQKPLSCSWIYQRFSGYARLAGIPADRCHPHAFRHSMAVHLMNAGWDAADVQDWLGHASIVSTMKYAKVSNRRREKMFRRTVTSREVANTT